MSGIFSRLGRWEVCMDHVRLEGNWIVTSRHLRLFNWNRILRLKIIPSHALLKRSFIPNCWADSSPNFPNWDRQTSSTRIFLMLKQFLDVLGFPKIRTSGFLCIGLVTGQEAPPKEQPNCWLRLGGARGATNPSSPGNVIPSGRATQSSIFLVDFSATFEYQRVGEKDWFR